ncbi:SRPBCC family protein [Paenarthrobacter sp. NPDC089675]|uniref:SRPBCC family protein n=1 Tax=Paenarthrobacter sp. NPDC089675 TaxID=3364376 RepID=UPI00380911EB
MIREFECSSVVPADLRAVSALFWDAAAWQRVWSPMDQIQIEYDDGVHQEFWMTVNRDGLDERVRTVRFRYEESLIRFFTPNPPPMMRQHAGSWDFAHHPDGTVVTATRRFAMKDRFDDSSLKRQWNADAFADSFQSRVDAILASFSSHFSDAGGRHD